MIKNKDVWMEAYKKKYDIAIYPKATASTPVTLIELKTVKNYDLPFWTSRLQTDIDKLRAAKRDSGEIRCFFMILSAFGQPSSQVVWAKKALSKEIYHDRLNKKLEEIGFKQPGVEKSFTDSSGMFNKMGITMHLLEV